MERDVRLRHEKEAENAESTRKLIALEQTAIDESRQHQLRCKLQEKQAAKMHAELHAKDWARIAKQEQELDRQKQLAKRALNIELRNIQWRQICESKARRAKDKADVLEEEHQVGICH